MRRRGAAACQACCASSPLAPGSGASANRSRARAATAPKWQVRTLDRRSNATSRQVRKPSSVTSGTPAAVSYETDKRGRSHHVRIRLTDTLQQAQALVARKP